MKLRILSHINHCFYLLYDVYCQFRSIFYNMINCKSLFSLILKNWHMLCNIKLLFAVMKKQLKRIQNNGYKHIKAKNQRLKK